MIYCVEDDTNIRELIVYTLISSGYEAKGCEDAASFFAETDADKAELFLLDIMLPGEDGLSILRKLKSMPDRKDIPVIMITAKDSEYDKVTGLDMGADDYIAKPFGMMEFLARVRALLRRSRTERIEDNEDILEYRELTIHRPQHKVTAMGQPVELTLKEFNLLEYLLLNEGIVLTRDMLLSRVWGYDFNGESRTVDVHIRTLRQKLGVCGDYIETVRGVGYKVEKRER
ncbi:MAG: response regulator transcription factor [Eubacterium sp.]|nr:response regulator transcription factor [Eubacterium sp.]